jgi:uncharacterized protein (UPF0216 family)
MMGSHISASAYHTFKNMNLARFGPDFPTLERIMTENITPIFALNWRHADKQGAERIAELEQHLDHRKKSLKDPDTNKAILAAVLAYRGTEFKVALGEIAEPLKPAVRDALECLKGPVLLSLGSNTYQVRDEFAFLRISGKVQTIEATTTEMETTSGAIYRDGSHGEREFKDFARFGFARPSLVTVVAPHRHWAIAFGEEPAPSPNWIEIVEQATPHPRHDELMDEIVEQARRRGVALLRYREDGFICMHPAQTFFWINNTLTMVTGRYGLSPLLEVIDAYGRKDKRWGSRPQ